MNTKEDRYAKYANSFTDRESIANEQMAWRRWASNRELPHPDGGMQSNAVRTKSSPKDQKHKRLTIAGVKVK